MLYTVEVRLGAIDLTPRMSDMRQWLDRHRYEPDLFKYQVERDGPVVCVEFKYEREALSFAEAFDGRIPRWRSEQVCRPSAGG